MTKSTADPRTEEMSVGQLRCHAKGHRWPDEETAEVWHRDGPGEKGVRLVRISEVCDRCSVLRYSIVSYPSYEPVFYGYRYDYSASPGYLAHNNGAPPLSRADYKHDLQLQVRVPIQGMRSARLVAVA